MVITGQIELHTQGNTDVLDITRQCADFIVENKVKNGILTVFNPGSTGSVTTIEYEPNLVRDLDETLDGIAPKQKDYHHRKTWHDDNGHSHMLATIMGPSVTVPVVDGKLTLGTWQQIVLCDFDTHPRRRSLILQLIGE